MRKKIYFTSAFFAVFLVFSSFINNGFSWLDHGDIERGRVVLPLSSLSSAFISRFGQTGFFRPIVTTVNSIDFDLYGLWAPGFHLTNVLLHLAATFMAALLLPRLFTFSFKEKLMVFLIAGFHPLAFLPVGAISYRQELLLALFTYLTLYFHLRKKLFPAYLCFLAALFSKETALFLLPVLILLFDRLFLSEIVLLLIYGLLRFLAVPEIWHTSASALPFPQTLGIRLAAVSRLLFQLLLPLKPALSDATRVVSMTDFKIIPAATLFIIPVIFFRRLKPDFKKAFILLAVLTLPALNIIPVPRFSSPHYIYLALPAAASLVVIFRKWCLKRYKSAIIGNVLVVIWLVIAGFSTFRAGFRFKNDLTLFEPEVAADDRFLEGHQYLGDYYFKINEFEKAQLHYESALEKDPSVIAFVDDSSVMNNLAGVYLAQNKPDEADEMLLELSLKPDWSDNQTLLYNRALIADKKGDYKKVITLLERQDISWNRPESLLLLSKARQMLTR